MAEGLRRGPEQGREMPRESAADRAKRLAKGFARYSSIFLLGAAADRGVQHFEAADAPEEEESAVSYEVDPVVVEREAAEKAEVEKKWGFDIRGIEITPSELAHLPSINNRDELNELDKKINAAIEDAKREGIDLFDSENHVPYAPYDEAEESYYSALNAQWDGYDALPVVAKAIASASLTNADMLSDTTSRARFLSMAAKTEVRVGVDKISAIYHSDSGKDILIHEWTPDASPLEKDVTPVGYSLYEENYTKDASGRDDLGFSNVTSGLGELPLEERAQWMEQHIVNELQRELDFSQSHLERFDVSE